jgi:hypothetical protein
MLGMVDPEGEAADIQGTGEGTGFTKEGSCAIFNFFFYQKNNHHSKGLVFVIITESGLSFMGRGSIGEKINAGKFSKSWVTEDPM